MKKSRFLLMVLLLVTVFTFTGCGNKANQQDPVAGDQHDHTVEQDIEDGGRTIKDDVEDAAEDAKDALEGDDQKKDKEKQTAHAVFFRASKLYSYRLQ